MNRRKTKKADQKLIYALMPQTQAERHAARRMRRLIAIREGATGELARTGGGGLRRRKNPTKAQKREKAAKTAAKRRVAVALAKFLKQANPAGKYAGAKMQRNKGGSITIIPIKVRRAK